MIGVVHPVGVPAGIKKDLLLVTPWHRHGDQRGVAAGVVPIPGDPVLALLGTAIGHHLALEGPVVEPAGLGQDIDLEARDLPKFEISLHRRSLAFACALTALLQSR